MTNSGCYNCTKREVGCHANCEIYQEYRKALDVINERRRKILANEYNPRRCKVGKAS